VCLVALSLGVFGLRCSGDPAIPFVIDRNDAPWIMFPHPPTGLMGLAPRDAPPVTSFRRSVSLPAAAAPDAIVTLRALRRFALHLNGRRIAASGDDDVRWRRWQRVDLGPWLRAGDNEIRIDVTNPTGPGLLALHSEGLAEPLGGEAGWSASFDDGPARRAVRAASVRVNPSSYDMPTPAEGLAARRDTVLLLFVLSVLAFTAGRSAAGRRWLPRIEAAVPLLIVLAWVGLLFASMLRIPVDVGFDARHHVAYVEFLLEHRRLPLATDGWTMFHPPAYYAPTAALVALQQQLSPGGDGLWAWKLPGFLAGLGSALLCWALARRVFGKDAREVGFAAVFGACLPMNLYVSSYVTNESLHAALAGALVLSTVGLLLSPRPRTAALAVWVGLVGLALLAKYTAWIVACVAGFFLVVRWWRVERAPAATVAGRVAATAAGVFVLAGWFYVRNVVHFGQPFPLNVDLPGATHQWWSPPGYYTPGFFLRFGSALVHPFLAGAHSAWDSLYATLWGDGLLASQVFARRRHPYWDYELMAFGYWLALPATLLVLAGAVRSLRSSFRESDGGRRAVHAFLLTLVYALLVSVLYMTLRQQDYGQVKAFYGLAAMTPLGIFFAAGFGALDARLEARGASWARALAYGWLGCFASVLLLSYRS
jgi:hypothetical protein